MRTDLEHSRECQHQATASTHQEDGGNVEQKRYQGIGNKDRPAYIPSGDLVEWFEPLCKRKDNEIDGSADWCIIMQRNKGVHLESMKKNLNHD